MTDLLTPPNGLAPTPPPAARDFTKKRKRLDFQIDDDTFEAAPVLPGDVFAEFVTLYNGTVDTETYQQQHDLLKSALELALLPESWQRFAERLKDKADPIDDDQMSDVILWLLEEYGMRPTKPSQPSSDGPASPESGTSSTENTQPEEPTSPASPQTAS
ncbi:hypothetical protein ACFUN7_24165 [Streptomyces sp. NPDC057236]|uniref:hypothetical protein n=1 Tax=Streptomyces sp. NPDC057236 TaxID=3346059 RepID=UPI003631675A